MKKVIVLIGVVVLLVFLGITIIGNDKVDQPVELVNVGDPLDPTIEFYNTWLDAVKSTTTSPMESNLLTNDFLNESVREYITNAQTDGELTTDPVLCQTVTPNRVGAKVSYIADTEAQLLVVARGGEEKSPEMAVVDLIVVDNKWQISKITCSGGEVPPEREFSFEREGFLLKSVPPPLNPDYWHLVFVENGIDGHTAPLFFGPESMCTSNEGTEAVCDETQFNNATKVLVQGEMTEVGADVKRMKFLVD